MYPGHVQSEDKFSQQLILKFMLASSPVEDYLRQNRPLSDRQVESLSVTLESLQTYLNIWKQKHGKKG